MPKAVTAVAEELPLPHVGPVFRQTQRTPMTLTVLTTTPLGVPHVVPLLRLPGGQHLPLVGEMTNMSTTIALVSLPL